MSKVQTPMARNTKKAKKMDMKERLYITLTGTMAELQRGYVMTPPNSLSTPKYRAQYRFHQSTKEPAIYTIFRHECEKRGIPL